MLVVVPCVGDAGNLAHRGGQPLQVGRPAPMIREHARRQRQLSAGDATCSEPDVGATESGEAPQHETAADQQEHGYGNLRRNEQAESCPLCAAEAGTGLDAASDRRVRSRVIPGMRDDGDQDCRQRRDTCTDRDHESVDANIGQRGRQRRGADRIHRTQQRRQPGGEAQAGGAARQADSQ